MKRQEGEEGQVIHPALTAEVAAKIELTAGQQLILEQFHHRLKATINALFTATKAIANGNVAVESQAGLWENLCSALLAQVPYAGSVLSQQFQNLMKERYKNKIKAISNKLSSYASMDTIVDALSSQITAYYQVEILDPIGESLPPTRLSRLLSDCIAWTQQKVDELQGKQKDNLSDRLIGLITRTIEQLFIALLDIPVYTDEDERQLPALLSDNWLRVLA